MSRIPVEIEVPIDKPLKQESNEAISRALDAEVGAFTRWFAEQGNSGLVKIEVAIIKTYLAWKLLYEDGCPASKD
jgi:hypothetical protein